MGVGGLKKAGFADNLSLDESGKKNHLHRYDALHASSSSFVFAHQKPNADKVSISAQSGSDGPSRNPPPAVSLRRPIQALTPFPVRKSSDAAGMNMKVDSSWPSTDRQGLQKAQLSQRRVSTDTKIEGPVVDPFERTRCDVELSLLFPTEELSESLPQPLAFALTRLLGEEGLRIKFKTALKEGLIDVERTTFHMEPRLIPGLHLELIPNHHQKQRCTLQLVVGPPLYPVRLRTRIKTLPRRLHDLLTMSSQLENADDVLKNWPQIEYFSLSQFESELEIPHAGGTVRITAAGGLKLSGAEREGAYHIKVQGDGEHLSLATSVGPDTVHMAGHNNVQFELSARLLKGSHIEFADVQVDSFRASEAMLEIPRFDMRVPIDNFRLDSAELCIDVQTPLDSTGQIAFSGRVADKVVLPILGTDGYEVESTGHAQHRFEGVFEVGDTDVTLDIEMKHAKGRLNAAHLTDPQKNNQIHLSNVGIVGDGSIHFQGPKTDLKSEGSAKIRVQGDVDAQIDRYASKRSILFENMGLSGRGLLEVEASHKSTRVDIRSSDGILLNATMKEAPEQGAHFSGQIGGTIRKFSMNTNGYLFFEGDAELDLCTPNLSVDTVHLVKPEFSGLFGLKLHVENGGVHIVGRAKNKADLSAEKITFEGTPFLASQSETSIEISTFDVTYRPSDDADFSDVSLSHFIGNLDADIRQPLTLKSQFSGDLNGLGGDEPLRIENADLTLRLPAGFSLRRPEGMLSLSTSNLNAKGLPKQLRGMVHDQQQFCLEGRLRFIDDGYVLEDYTFGFEQHASKVIDKNRSVAPLPRAALKPIKRHVPKAKSLDGAEWMTLSRAVPDGNYKIRLSHLPEKIGKGLGAFRIRKDTEAILSLQIRDGECVVDSMRLDFRWVHADARPEAREARRARVRSVLGIAFEGFYFEESKDQIRIYDPVNKKVRKVDAIDVGVKIKNFFDIDVFEMPSNVTDLCYALVESLSQVRDTDVVESNAVDIDIFKDVKAELVATDLRVPEGRYRLRDHLVGDSDGQQQVKKGFDVQVEHAHIEHVYLRLGMHPKDGVAVGFAPKIEALNINLGSLQFGPSQMGSDFEWMRIDDGFVQSRDGLVDVVLENAEVKTRNGTADVGVLAYSNVSQKPKLSLQCVQMRNKDLGLDVGEVSGYVDDGLLFGGGQNIQILSKDKEIVFAPHANGSIGVRRDRLLISLLFEDVLFGGDWASAETALLDSDSPSDAFLGPDRASLDATRFKVLDGQYGSGQDGRVWMHPVRDGWRLHLKTQPGENTVFEPGNRQVEADVSFHTFRVNDPIYGGTRKGPLQIDANSAAKVLLSGQRLELGVPKQD